MLRQIFGARSCVKILKAFAILLGGPILGLFIALLLGVACMPSDPNFVANGGHVAPGDGIPVALLVLLSVIISVPTIYFAVMVLLKKAPPENLSDVRVVNSSNKE